MGKRPDAHGLISSGNGLRLRCSYSEECYDASRRPSADAVYSPAETSRIRSQIHFSYFKL
ncbi:rCG60527 [Rattus norvegicus]|uniref:RCG60527 n=1 Tax=Rattus norvegicus TaxID=10116 RepID=A6KKE1_RAT|nr:rCG60527 [Rattus norvegicus]